MRPKEVLNAVRESQIILPSVPTIKKIHDENIDFKPMFNHYKVSVKPKNNSKIVTGSKIFSVEKLRFSGNRISFSGRQFKPRIKMGKLEKFETKDIGVSTFVRTKEVMSRSFSPQPKSIVALETDQEGDALTEEELKKLWSGYTSAVRKMIAQAKVYPSTARDKGQQGKIDISFKLSKHGKLMKLFVEKSSGNNILDDAARNAVKNAGPFPPIPEKLNKQYVLLELPVSFVLR